METAGSKKIETIKKYFTDIFMIPLMIITTYSGLTIHIAPRAHATPMGLEVHQWRDVHMISAFLWLFLMVLHVYQHWGWYKNTFLKLNFKNKKLSTAISLLTFGLSVTGILLFLHILPRDAAHTIAEFHDKFGEVLVILLIFHIVQRFKWIVKSTKDILSNVGNEAAFATYILRNNGKKAEE